MAHGTRATARRTILAATFATLLVLGPGTAPNARETPPPQGAMGRTTILFNDDILENLGIELIGVATTAAPYRDGSLGFAIEAGGWLEYTGAEVNTADFSAGSLRHGGGFVLAFNDLELSIDGFELRVAEAPYAFDLLDTQGKRWFRLGSMQYELSPDASELRLINTDMLLSPEFASILGRNDLANSYLAVIDMVVPVELPRRRAIASVVLSATGVDCPVPDIGQPVDISLSGLDSVTQLAREPGGRVAIAASADLTNVGTNSVEWFQAIIPDDVPGDIGPHPYLSLHLYRLADGRLREIGQSDVKHAFQSVNSGCVCPAGHTIYPGCSDRYGVFTNGQRIHLAPRDGVSALTGSWTRLGSHFDSYSQTMMAIDPALTDDVRSHAGDSDHDDSFEHRLFVQEADLMDTNAQYFYGAWYVVADDSNIVNSMGHRQVVPNLVGNTWSFELATGLTEGSILDEFVNPVATPVGQDNDFVDTTEGRFQIAVRTSNLPNGLFHYEYAIVNFDFDRQIRSFRVPLAAGVTASNVEFADVDTNAGNDWSIVLDPGGAITWTAPNGNELDWGTLYNFAFDANGPAAAANLTVTALEAGAPLAAVSSIPEPSSSAALAAALGTLAALQWLRSPRRR